MWRKLKPHPMYRAPYVDAIEATAARRSADEISLRFRIFGNLNMLQMKKAKRQSERLRRDELWQTTCLELFVRKPGADSYVELNLASSGDWAAYGFDRYRQEIQDAECGSPHFRAKGVARGCDVAATFEFPTLQIPPGEVEIGLSAIIESIDGTKSYWALAHPPGAPDFHHPTCFAARLPAPSRL